MTETRLKIIRTLHDEHIAVLSLLDRFDAFLRKQADRPPARGDVEASRVLGELAAALAGEISEHFAFEEDALFPLLAEIGETEIGEMLAEEHVEIRPVAERLITLTKAGLSSGFGTDDWAEFRRLGAMLIDRLGEHAQKEEAALLPMLEDVLDEQQDISLSQQYTH